MTYPLATLAPTLSAAGVTAVALEDIFQSLTASGLAIFGPDTYLQPDSQDGQLLAIVSQAAYDAGMAIVGAINQFSPSSASGVGLASVVKINGIRLEAGTNSQAVVQITGTAGTVITNGVVEDSNANLWTLPVVVTIPATGIILVTATCQTSGAITALAGTINSIYNLQLGWQGVVNTAAATVGTANETDASLRARQTISTSLPSQTALGSIQGAIANIAGVTRSRVYQNDQPVTDANGIPRNSIAVVVAGGSATEIAQTIELQKDQGAGTFGNQTIIVTDPGGLPIPIKFFVLIQNQIYVSVNILALPGYLDTTGDLIIAAVVDFINALQIGENAYQPWLAAEASLANTAVQQSFVVTGLTLGLSAGAQGTASLITEFNAAAICSTANVTLTVSSS